MEKNNALPYIKGASHYDVTGGSSNYYNRAPGSVDRNTGRLSQKTRTRCIIHQLGPLATLTLTADLDYSSFFSIFLSN